MLETIALGQIERATGEWPSRERKKKWQTAEGEKSDRDERIDLLSCLELDGKS